MRSKHQFYKVRVATFALLTFLLFPVLFGGMSHSSSDLKEGNSEVLMNNIIWRETSRLTWLGNSTKPQIMRSGDGNYNIVWQDDRNGQWDIYYLRVRPDGFKVVNDTRITYFKGNDTNPVIGVMGDHIYIVWQRYVSGHWAIYFSRLLYSNKNILIEIPPIPVRKINTDCINPKIAVDSNGDIDLVWQELNGSHWEIMYDKLDSYGTPLFSPILVSQSYMDSMRPSIVVDNNNDVHIFWVGYSTTPGYSIFYRKLSPKGSFLTEIRRISVVSPKSTVESYYYNNSLYTVFSCSRERLAYEVIFTRLSSSGYTEVDDTNLTVADKIDSMYPHLAVIHDRMFVVWNDNPMGVIKFSIYDLNGNKIGEVLNISASNSFFPSISVNDRTIGIVWQKEVNGKFYLYFRSAEFPDLKVESMSLYAQGSNITLKASLYSSVPLTTTYGIYLDGNLTLLRNVYINNVVNVEEILNATPGWHRVKIFIDPFNHIIETNESNNAMEKMIYVKHYSFNVSTNPVYYLPAGRWSNISVYLSNTGNWVDNYTMRILYNTSLFKVQPDFKKVRLNESENEIVNFSVYTYKSTIVGNYTMNLTVRSISSGIVEMRNITVRVLPYVNFNVEYAPMYTVLPGKKINIEMIIENTGNCNDTYILNVHQSKNWPMMYESKLNVSYHSSKSIYITLLVPNGTYGFTKNYLNLTIKSSRLNITKKASIMVIVKPVHKASVSVLSLIENGTYYYTARIKVVNEGNMRDLFTITLSGNAAQFSYISNASLVLNPQGSYIVILHTYLPPYMPAGSYKVDFNVNYDNRSLASVPLLLTVQESHQFIVNVKVLSQGKKVVLAAIIRNVGNTPELIMLIPKLAEKTNATWILYYNHKNFTNVTSVYVKQNQTVNVTITLATNLTNGMHKATIIFRSASHITKNVTVEFRVGEKSIWEKIGDFIMGNLTYVIIAAAVIVGVIVYFIKFRE